MKKFILVLSLIATLGLVSTVQAGTIIEPDISQSQLRSDSLAAFAATANIGAPMSSIEAGEMRGEFLPIVYYYAVVYGVPAAVMAGAWAARFRYPTLRAAIDAFGG